jgi:aminopeptidase
LKDSRISALADILVNYSVEVKPGDVVLITGTELAQPLMEEVYTAVLKAGAFPRLKVSFSTLLPLFFQHAQDRHLDTLLELDHEEYARADCLINIKAPANVKELSGVDPKRITRRVKTMEPIKDLIIGEKIRWVLVNYPTQALAQEASMSLQEYEDFAYSATNLDWREESKKQDNIKAAFDQGSLVRIQGPGTDLQFSIAGRLGEKCDGHKNMPDGEVFYAPVEDSAEGFITYDFPAIFQGQEVDQVYLEFEKGVVVKATAGKNQALLESVLALDEGARRLGEFGIGVNYGLSRFSKDILFDEKLGGTIHLALGSAYPKIGGTNRSAIHWDMIKDLRQGGSLTLDGKVVQKDGVFTLD